MERRVFGCSEFSDIIFRNGLNIIEKIFDFVLEDQEANEYFSFKSTDSVPASKGATTPN